MPEPLFIIPRPNGDELRFDVSEFKGKKYFSVRLWYDASQDTSTKDMRPTQKGVNLSVEMFPEFMQGIEKIKEAL